MVDGLPQNDEKTWMWTLAVVEQSYRLRQPDAHTNALRLLGKLNLTVAGLQKRDPEGLKQIGKDYAKRAHDLHTLIVSASGRQTLKERDAEGPTPETISRPARADPITELHTNGKISNAALDASREIARVYEAITRRLTVRAQDYSGVGGGGGPESDIPTALAEIHADVYLPWTRAMLNHQFQYCRLCGYVVGEFGGGFHRCGPSGFRALKTSLEFTMDIIVDGEPVDRAMRRYRMGRRKALILLVEALELYVEIKKARMR